MMTRIGLAAIAIAALLTLIGYRAEGVGLLVLSIFLLEMIWWQARPTFERSFRARWEHSLRFYAEVHQDPFNRFLHILGIPFLWFGSIALVFAPLHQFHWWMGAMAFAIGAILNAVGHIVFEPESDAYAAGHVDVLSIFSSVIWDLSRSKSTMQQCVARFRQLSPHHASGERL